jgi:hypothetical protein
MLGLLAAEDSIGGLNESVLSTGVRDPAHLQGPGFFIVLVLVHVLVHLKFCIIVVCDLEEVLVGGVVLLLYLLARGCCWWR